MTNRKTIALTRRTFVGKVMSPLFNTLSRLVIVFLLRGKCFLILWLQSLSAVILKPRKRKSVSVSIVSPSVCHEVMWPVAMFLVFWILSLEQAFVPSSFPLIKRLFSSSSFLPLRWYHLHIWGYWYSPSNLDSSLWFTQPGISFNALST